MGEQQQNLPPPPPPPQATPHMSPAHGYPGQVGMMAASSVAQSPYARGFPFNAPSRPVHSPSPNITVGTNIRGSTPESKLKFLKLCNHYLLTSAKS